MMIRRDVPGLAMAKEYVGTKVRGLTSLELVSERERPDLVAVLNRQDQQTAVPGSTIYATAGEVDFKGMADGTVCVGSYFVGTTRTMYQAPGIEAMRIWNANSPRRLRRDGEEGGPRSSGPRSSREEPPRRTRSGRACSRGSRPNPSGSSTTPRRTFSKMITDSYWKRSAGETELSRRRSNATLGVEDVVDQSERCRIPGRERLQPYPGSIPGGRSSGRETDGAPTTTSAAIRRP